MNGIFVNPFVEGLILVALGIGTIVAGRYLNAPNLGDIGQTVIGVGLGYFVHSAVVKPMP